MNKKISYSAAQITKKDLISISEASKDGWGSNHNKFVNKFEKDFAKKIKVKFSLATSSCTGALHIAISSLNLKKNSEVLICDSNWVATLSPIIYENLTPVFVDADYNSWCIDVKKIEKKITKKTKLIIVTHLYGNIADIKEIIKIAKKHDLFVIEDAAEALGSKLNGKMCGTFGDIGCYSFHGSKIITTGEGGMLVTNNKSIYKRCITLANHGRELKKYHTFVADRIGYKYKMTNLQAALGISQLKNLEKKLKKKKFIFETYKNNLKNLKIRTNIISINNINSYWMTNIVFDLKYKINISKLINYLKKFNIESRSFFPPLSMMKMFKTKPKKNSLMLYKNSINLPSSLIMKKSDMVYVSKKIKEFIKKKTNYKFN